jgi:hypothetical protein
LDAPVTPCDPSPCLYGFACTDLGDGTYNCNCSDGHSGLNCEIYDGMVIDNSTSVNDNTTVIDDTQNDNGGSIDNQVDDNANSNEDGGLTDMEIILLVFLILLVILVIWSIVSMFCAVGATVSSTASSVFDDEEKQLLVRKNLIF